ncbi:hypothetical protein CRENBAI_013039 [Crenichthys baileyi]|uniref:Uncharacterized protein n=1 Tax=Crenichthys baileyi TaxID=28760 RepID=A0AAV9SQF2_9TELE
MTGIANISFSSATAIPKITDRLGNSDRCMRMRKVCAWMKKKSKTHCLAVPTLWLQTVQIQAKLMTGGIKCPSVFLPFLSERSSQGCKSHPGRAPSMVSLIISHPPLPLSICHMKSLHKLIASVGTEWSAEGKRSS